MVFKWPLHAVVLFVLSSALACSGSKNGQSAADEEGLQRIYVDTVNRIDSKSGLGEVQVRIKGNLPSPAYSFEKFRVNVEGRSIRIVPLATHDPDKMVAQMLVPFEEVCSVGKLAPGAYRVDVLGRGGNGVSSVEINVQ